MQTNVHEIADGVHRLSTCVPDVAPGGFTFNQFLVAADEPVLWASADPWVQAEADAQLVRVGV